MAEPSVWPAWVSAFGALASALAAIVAVVFSNRIHKESRELSELTARPVIGMRESTVNIKTVALPNNSKAFDIELILGFENIGQHPAENLEYGMWNVGCSLK